MELSQTIQPQKNLPREARSQAELTQTRTWAEISLNNLEHNYGELLSVIPENSGIIGIVKANAYGHGAVPVAARLERLGCRLLAVACMAEAAELRGGGNKSPILLLGSEPAASALEAARLGVTMTVGDLETARETDAQIREIGASIPEGINSPRRAYTSFGLPTAKAAAVAPLKIHLKLDTGMGRTGFDASDDREIKNAAAACTLPNIEVEGIFTHFAVSDETDAASLEYTKLQFRRFMTACDQIERLSGKKIKFRHCANSGGVINYAREMSLDFIRPGIALYGGYGKNTHDLRLGGFLGDTRGLDLLPVMTLKSRIAAIYNRRAGETISYGRTRALSRDSKIAVLPIGYADGLPRCLSNRFSVFIGGKAAPQIGRVCMDMCMVNVTDLPNVQIGDTAVIFGENGNTAAELAETAGTISNEIFCGITNRVPRIYV